MVKHTFVGVTDKLKLHLFNNNYVYFRFRLLAKIVLSLSLDHTEIFWLP